MAFAHCSGARRQESGVLPCFADHQAARTESGRPRSSIRLRTVTAILISASCAGRVCERKVSPMIRLYRLIAPSAPALALYGDGNDLVTVPQSAAPPPRPDSPPDRPAARRERCRRWTDPLAKVDEDVVLRQIVEHIRIGGPVLPVRSPLSVLFCFWLGGESLCVGAGRS
jgi:hypothetical protein